MDINITIAMQALHCIKDNKIEQINRENPDVWPDAAQNGINSAHRLLTTPIWKYHNYKIPPLPKGATPALFKRWRDK